MNRFLRNLQFSDQLEYTDEMSEVKQRKVRKRKDVSKKNLTYFWMVLKIYFVKWTVINLVF